MIKKLTLLFLLYQNLQKIWIEHYGYSFLTKEAQIQGLKNGALIDFRLTPCPNNDQFWFKRKQIKFPSYLKNLSDYKSNPRKAYRNIWSSVRYCFRHLVSSLDDSESRPNGFSTITLVHPVAEEALVLAHFTTSTNMFGGMDK